MSGHGPRFAVSFERAGELSGAELADDARHAEALGFDMITMSDHGPGRRPGAEPSTAAGFVLGVTRRIAVLPLLTGPYRHPALVARIAAQLDALAPGRVVLGIGGGTDADTSPFGMEAWIPEETVERERETIDIVRGLLRTPAFGYRGRYYRLDGATIEPRPAAPVPIWVGAAGPRSLRLIGQLADGWMPGTTTLPLETARVLRDRITAAATRAGRPPGAVTHAIRLELGAGEETDADAVRAVVAAGFDHVVFHLRGDVRLQREHLARDVLPGIRHPA